MFHWDQIHERNVTQVLTKTLKPVKGPYVDSSKQLHNETQLAKESINPKMKFQKSYGSNVIAVGSFPAEYWDIYPGLQWFQFDFAGFMEALRRNTYDLAIVGAAGSDAMKLVRCSNHGTIICYQPTMYLDIPRRNAVNLLQTDFPTMFSRIKHEPVGTPLAEEGAPFSGYNNRYWIYQWYEGKEPVWRDGNTVFCNGWVLPQYLIRDGYLEVN